MKRKTLATAGAIATSMMLMGGAAQADCGEVSITEMDWGSALVVTAVAQFLMEQGYGCDVTTVPSASNPAMASVAETGEPDLLTEIWTNGAPAYEGLIADGTITELTHVLSDGGVEGWFVPDYLVEAHPELATLDGILANPELVGGRFHNCPEGWTCKIINSNVAIAAGLAAAGIEDYIHGSGETLATSIAAAYENQEPWFGYYWSPTSLLGRYPMVQIDLGEHDADAQECNRLAECESPALQNYPASIVTTAVANSFLEENPDIAELMTNLSFTNAQMNEVLAWQEINSASPDEAAVYFLTTYPDVWGAWLNDEARERLSALLQ